MINEASRTEERKTERILMEPTQRRITTHECASLRCHAEWRRHDARLYPYLFTDSAKADLEAARAAIEEALMMLNEKVV